MNNLKLKGFKTKRRYYFIDSLQLLQNVFVSTVALQFNKPHGKYYIKIVFD